jgi:DNA-binding MarR family transcriptional regulator
MLTIVMADSDIEKLGFLLHETARVWRTKLDQRLKPLGLSMGKWTTLAHLARGGDKLTQAEVAARVGIEGPTLAGILDRLEQDGWVKRKSCVDDRRCKTVHLQKRSAPCSRKSLAPPRVSGTSYCRAFRSAISKRASASSPPFATAPAPRLPRASRRRLNVVTGTESKPSRTHA